MKNKISRVCILFYFIDSEWVACRLIETNCVRSAFNSTQCSLFFMNASFLIDDSLLVCKWDSMIQHG